MPDQGVFVGVEPIPEIEGGRVQLTFGVTVVPVPAEMLEKMDGEPISELLEMYAEDLGELPENPLLFINGQPVDMDQPIHGQIERVDVQRRAGSKGFS